MGWDDNGVPTERRVENFYGVRCDPTLPYDPDFQPPAEPPKGNRRDDLVRCSRRNFVELCFGLTAEDEQAFEELWRHLGLSVDWSLTYTTINDQSRRASQRAFLRNLARGEAYQSEAPTLWDVRLRDRRSPRPSWRTASSPGAYHQIAFGRDGGDPLVIDTTRPELIPACVALVAHPDDERYQPLFETHGPHPAVRRPGSRQGPPPGRPGEGHRHRHDLHLRRHHRRDLVAGAGPARAGRRGSERPSAPRRARRVHRRGHRPLRPSSPARPCSAPRSASSSCWARPGRCEGEPRPITHPVKFYEKGDKPLEIVTTRQWYIRNGGREDDLRQALIARGKELDWHPGYMQVRYEDWVEGLNGDWLISRQRFFGVPIPVWYGVGADGEVDHDTVLVPDEDALPVDPSSEVPPGLRRGPARPAGRLRGRRRHHGHLGHVLAHAPDRGRVGRRRGPVPAGLPDGPAPPGPRHHPHLAVLDRGAVPLRARHRPLAARRHLRLDPRPGPQEDVEVQGQRRRRRWPCSSSTAPTPCATGPPTADRAPTPRSTRAR